MNQLCMQSLKVGSADNSVEVYISLQHTVHGLRIVLSLKMYVGESSSCMHLNHPMEMGRELTIEGN